MARLTAAARRALPDSAFAGPGRTYPEQDAAHARAAIGLSAMHGASPSVRAGIKATAKRRFGIGKGKSMTMSEYHRG